VLVAIPVDVPRADQRLELFRLELLAGGLPLQLSDDLLHAAHTVLGMSARNAAGVVLGQEVLKLDQNGKVLMMLGKMGVGGRGTDTFDRPTGVAIGANGDIFVSDGHGGNASNNARVVDHKPAAQGQGRVSAETWTDGVASWASLLGA
jgi:NHL repeat